MEEPNPRLYPNQLRCSSAQQLHAPILKQKKNDALVGACGSFLQDIFLSGTRAIESGTLAECRGNAVRSFLPRAGLIGPLRSLSFLWFAKSTAMKVKPFDRPGSSCYLYTCRRARAQNKVPFGAALLLFGTINITLNFIFS
jgi:hypothetical protein